MDTAHTITCASRSLTAYAPPLLDPTSDPLPGVLVIHEIFGLTDHIRGVADRFAQEGYVALAVDLFSGRNKAACMVQAIYGMMARPLANGIVKDLQTSLAYLETMPGVDPTRLGVIGFCMGGGYALQLACVDDRLKVGAAFYGTNPRPLDALAKSCPLTGSYPEKDFTAKQAIKLEATLTAHSITHDIKVYPGAKHGFFNEDRASVYDVTASQDAWERTVAFFAQELGTKPSPVNATGH